MEVGIRDLKNNLSRHLEKVKEGETIIVTDRGKPVAKLEPVEGLSNFDRLLAEGKISRPDGPKVRTDDLPGPLPTGLPPGETYRIIDEGRGPR